MKGESYLKGIPECPESWCRENPKEAADKINRLQSKQELYKYIAECITLVACVAMFAI